METIQLSGSLRLRSLDLIAPTSLPDGHITLQPTEVYPALYAQCNRDHATTLHPNSTLGLTGAEVLVSVINAHHIGPCPHR